MAVKLGPGYFYIKKPSLRSPKNKGWYVIIGFENAKAEGFGITEEDAVKNACRQIAQKMLKNKHGK